MKSQTPPDSAVWRAPAVTPETVRQRRVPDSLPPKGEPLAAIRYAVSQAEWRRMHRAEARHVMPWTRPEAVLAVLIASLLVGAIATAAGLAALGVITTILGLALCVGLFRATLEGADDFWPDEVQLELHPGTLVRRTSGCVGAPLGPDVAMREQSNEWVFTSRFHRFILPKSGCIGDVDAFLARLATERDARPDWPVGPGESFELHWLSGPRHAILALDHSLRELLAKLPLFVGVGSMIGLVVALVLMRSSSAGWAVFATPLFLLSPFVPILGLPFVHATATALHRWWTRRDWRGTVTLTLTSDRVVCRSEHLAWEMPLSQCATSWIGSTLRLQAGPIVADLPRRTFIGGSPELLESALTRHKAAAAG